MQIVGTAKCRDTKKCRLWFDQRGISYHFVDLAKRPLSPGEMNSIAACSSWEELINKDGAVWKKLQLEWKSYDAETELMEHQGLMITPVVREGRKAIVGLKPEAWADLTGK